MNAKHCKLIGAPVQTGASQAGCIMGPDSLRTAGLRDALAELGHTVEDTGNLQPVACKPVKHKNHALKHLAETIDWGQQLFDAGYEAMNEGKLPIFLGGDHSIAIGTVPGVARAANDNGKSQFVLWLDAHPDIHDLNTTTSGNLHGTPVAYFAGFAGFEKYYPSLEVSVPPENICMLGIRSVDPAEKDRLARSKVKVHDMRAIDEYGIAAPLRKFIDRVKREDGALHVSLDVDFLDPDIAPAVGTTVPGGASFREAHLVMEMLCDSGLVTSLELVELNPFLDERGRTAKLMVDLCASLMGRRVLDRMTRSY